MTIVDYTHSPEVQELMDREDELVPAAAIAPIVHMNESVIIRYAKTGKWDQENLGKFVISGNRVKFFRKDFLQKCGFLPPDPEEPTEKEALLALISGLETVLKAQKQVILLLEEQNSLLKEGRR